MNRIHPGRQIRAVVLADFSVVFLKAAIAGVVASVLVSALVLAIA